MFVPIGDTALARVSRVVPGGLGGVITRGGIPVLLLVHPEQRAEAIAALRDLHFPPTIPLDAPGVQLEQVRWSYADLYDWYVYVIPQVKDEHVVLSAIDQTRNRIIIGVLGDADRRILVNRLSALSIPCDLVGVVVTGAAPTLVGARY